MHPRFRSSPKMSKENRGAMQTEEEYSKHNSVDPSSGYDLQSDTIVKQRRELQLLIGELQDRDRELNDMVAAHQQQLSAWERDRRKLVAVEQRSEKMEMEIRKRNEQLRLLIQRLKVSDTKHRSKDEALECLQNKLKKAEINASEAKAYKQELQSQNDVLNTSLSDLNCRIGSLETKEQQFVTQLQLKEGDLVGAESQISELNSKLRRLESELNECKRNGAAAHADLEDQRAKFRHCQGELDKTISEMATKTSDLIGLRQEIAILRDESQKMKQEMYLAEEQIRRKEELLNLQKSKQERTDLELCALRELYERQQQELADLQLNLTNSQEMLSKQEERLNNISQCGLEFDGLDSSSQTTNDLLEEARRSTEEDPFGYLRSPKCKTPKSASPTHQAVNDGLYSPTSKLQRLLNESRDMVHCLEKQAALPTKSYTSRHNRHNY
uniref:Coiled-coil domain-containing protein 62 n=1 Tax=Phallusia mammillata TaxID=59560 RepID=A0A6F9D8F9_9ASCI|nr:coiled-coil domain-containing protein 62 [Phallusia mammillata]